jgi:hypothetical protein
VGFTLVFNPQSDISLVFENRRGVAQINCRLLKDVLHPKFDEESINNTVEIPNHFLKP